LAQAVQGLQAVVATLVLTLFSVLLPLLAAAAAVGRVGFLVQEELAVQAVAAVLQTFWLVPLVVELAVKVLLVAQVREEQTQITLVVAVAVLRL
jgi:hypothetical protein